MNEVWRSSTTVNLLKKRAEALKRIREFFEHRGVLEVETPLLCHHGSCDPFIKSWRAYVDGADKNKACYLQTSPEYAMKRLLASGSGSIYQMGKAFRGDEEGRYHNPEFTLLEWYRVDWTYQQLMVEVTELVQQFLPTIPITHYSYRQLFLEYLSLDPWQVTAQELQNSALAHEVTIPDAVDVKDIDMWLMWLMATVIEPQWKGKGLVFVYDYPPSQAILAALAETEYGTVAKRFEVYIDGIELANGFQELQDATTQRRRFVADNEKRRRLGLPEVVIDEHLLAALRAGLPACAGVALGIDRLLLSIFGQETLSQIMAFSFAKV
ncbi:MAG: epmA [Gammaproteobacteria bacterium]|nr:epmA [Gammaproteobacteria bacterium]